MHSEAGGDLDDGLRSPSGPEQAGLRPALIIQDDLLTSSLSTVIVVPLTTNLKRLAIPTSVLLATGEGGLPQDSVALCHQVQVRGKARLISRLGAISADRLLEVQGSLLNALGL